MGNPMARSQREIGLDQLTQGQFGAGGFALSGCEGRDGGGGGISQREQRIKPRKGRQAIVQPEQLEARPFDLGTCHAFHKVELHGGGLIAEGNASFTGDDHSVDPNISRITLGLNVLQATPDEIAREVPLFSDFDVRPGGFGNEAMFGSSFQVKKASFDQVAGLIVRQRGTGQHVECLEYARAVLQCEATCRSRVVDVQ